MAKKSGGTGAKFTREALVNSKKFAGKRDVLMIVLKDGEEYSMEEVNSRIQGFLETPIVETVNKKG